MLLADAIAPAALVTPVAFLALLVLGMHVLSVARSDMPASRRRIRMANGMLMMFTVPLAVYAFGFASPDSGQGREFALAWMLVAGMLVLIIAVALLDVANTFRLHLPERAKMRSELRAARESLESAARAARSRASEQPTTPA